MSPATTISPTPSLSSAALHGADTRPLIAVCGARGQQGSSVIDFLLRDGSFRVRALTRVPESSAAQELTKRGVEVVQADFAEPQSLVVAFEGVYGVFGMTDWNEHGDAEFQHGINLVDAAKKVDVKHFVWSCMETVEGMEFFGRREAVRDYLKQVGVPHTCCYWSFYYPYVFQMALSRQSSGWTMHFPCPSTQPLACMNPSDIGGFVLAAFSNPTRWLGNDMKVCTEYITPRELADVFANVTGESVRFVDVTREGFVQMRGDVHPFVWKMMDWFQAYEHPRDEVMSREVHPGALDWRAFVEKRMEEEERPAMNVWVHVEETADEVPSLWVT